MEEEIRQGTIQGRILYEDLGMIVWESASSIYVKNKISGVTVRLRENFGAIDAQGVEYSDKFVKFGV